MKVLYILASLGLIASTVKDPGKTKKSLKTAVKVFVKMLPLLLKTLIIVSIVLYFLPDYIIAKYLGSSNMSLGVVLGALFGSISLLPGFITFPLAGLLLKEGVSYTVLAVFTTTLMMVGAVTFPIEREIFGTKLTVARNVSGLIIALITSLVIGIIYGEVF